MAGEIESSLHLNAEIDELVDEYLARKQAGEDISVEQFAEIYSSRKEEILELLPVVDYLETSDPKSIPQPVETENLPSVLLGDYSINRLIGFGGMGTVYEAEHFLRSQVALKVMVAKDGEDGRRFEREAKILSGLHHPNIVPVFDFGSIDNTNFMSMRYINGPNLSQVMAARNADSAPSESAFKIADRLDKDWSALAKVGYQVAQALDYAHNQGVLHRDIKPANLLIEDDDHVWVTDFGLAKLNYEVSSLTKTGNAVGTLQYMAPEQLDNHADVRTDIYSLGITLYELTLRNQKSSNSAYIRHPLKKPSHFSPSIPKGLENVILKACRPDPEERYQTAADLAQALARYCGHRKSIQLTDDRTNWSLRNIVTLAATFVLALSIIIHSKNNEGPKTILEHALSRSLKEQTTRVVFDPQSNIHTMITRVSCSTDDAEEWNGKSSVYPIGKVYWKSRDLEMVWDEGEQFIGIRFSQPVIPKGAEIKSAFIQFTADQQDIGLTNLKIRGDLSKLSETFRRTKFNISNRPTTESHVEWSDIPVWHDWEAGAAQRTPDLKEIINEIMSRPAWQSNSPLTFIFTGTGNRTATTFDYDPVHAPKLIIEYSGVTE